MYRGEIISDQHISGSEGAGHKRAAKHGSSILVEYNQQVDQYLKEVRIGLQNQAHVPRTVV